LSQSRRVLVVGGGGREHALAWKLARDGAEVIVAPGNAGTALVAENVPVAADDIPALVALARSRSVDLTVVGPEAPLVAGIVDAFTAAGLRIFGPSAAAAQLEGSKIFCKQMLHRGDVPTAMFREFRSAAAARSFLESREDAPVVIKADGLAAGKGVFVCTDRAAALEAVATLADDPQLAAAAGGILVEERLEERRNGHRCRVARARQSQPRSECRQGTLLERERLELGKAPDLPRQRHERAAGLAHALLLAILCFT
jgi:phosphoribosylamine--glycine ligase